MVMAWSNVWRGADSAVPTLVVRAHLLVDKIQSIEQCIHGIPFRSHAG